METGSELVWPDLNSCKEGGLEQGPADKHQHAAESSGCDGHSARLTLEIETI